MSENRSSYDDACEHHARRQGLGPLMDALTEAGDIPWDLWQSGGWTMVLTVPWKGEGFFGITSVAMDVEETPRYGVCLYPTGDHGEAEDEHVVADGIETRWVLDVLRTWRTFSTA
jgi:hypothetical protein